MNLTRHREFSDGLLNCWGNGKCLLTGQDFYLEINRNVLEVDSGDRYNRISILKATQLYT